MKFTRLAVTLASDPGESKTHTLGYFLNGRRPGRSAVPGALGITVDRAHYGSIFVLHGQTDEHHDAVSTEALAEDLERVRVQVDTPGRHRIDRFINELADSSLQACGRHNRQQTGWFSGLMVRDHELVAVTQGEAVAYLYRSDAFIPLTEDNLEWPAEDAFGNAVKDYSIYQGGRSGPLRYSNIASLREGDCLVLAPEQIFGRLGQREMLRIFDAAENQEDAAVLIMERMKGLTDDAPPAILVAYVEAIYEAKPDRRGRFPSMWEIEKDRYVQEAQRTMGDSEEQSRKQVPRDTAPVAAPTPAPEKQTEVEPASAYRRPSTPEKQVAEQVPEQAAEQPKAEPKPLRAANATPSPMAKQEEKPAIVDESLEASETAELPLEEIAYEVEEDDELTPFKRFVLKYWPIGVIVILVIVIIFLIWQLLQRLGIL